MIPYIGSVLVTQQYLGNRHLGIDLVGMDSKNVLSIGNGSVVHTGNINGFGNAIIIKQDDYYVLYGHLSQININNNNYINAGEVIGVEGSTGNSTGSHLHLEIFRTYKGYYNGLLSNTIDPSEYMQIYNREGYLAYNLISREGSNITRGNEINRNNVESNNTNEKIEIKENVPTVSTILVDSKGMEFKTPFYEEAPVNKETLHLGYLNILVITFFAGTFFYKKLKKLKKLKNKRRKIYGI